jgi:regulator of protease activity HflC (stomatin/prohibitin superfamily)
MMKRSIVMSLGLSLILLTTLLTGCMQRVPAGNVGILVKLYGEEKGVETKEYGPGSYWPGWNEQWFLFPTFTQNEIWTKSVHEGKKLDESITFQSREGLEINSDFGLTYRIRPGRASAIFQKFRKGLDEVSDTYLRNQTRDALIAIASTMSVEDAYGPKKRELVEKAQKQLSESVGDMFEIEKLTVVGSFRLPAPVLAALESKIAATQKAMMKENELREAEAEAKKVVAKARGDAEGRLALAEAEAKANYLVAKSLTPELVQWQALAKWNGALPQFTGGGAVPFINIK